MLGGETNPIEAIRSGRKTALASGKRINVSLCHGCKMTKRTQRGAGRWRESIKTYPGWVGIGANCAIGISNNSMRGRCSRRGSMKSARRLTIVGLNQ
jgi:hypothetical protein